MNGAKKLSLRDVLETWWPLAASWLMMGFELPAVSAVMARLPDPEINLAAYGGVVFPLALLIEGPIIMILAASTALSRDRDSYVRLRDFMIRTAAALTALHLLIACTPLYYWIVDRLMGVPAEIQGPARTGLIILTPWTAAIAYRRFIQGVLIRFGRSRTVGTGTIVRLLSNVAVLVCGFYWSDLSGIVIGTLAVSVGVTAEAIFAGIAVRPVLRHELPSRGEELLTMKKMLAFYIPLALAPLIVLFAQPVVSSAMSRMPRPLDSLAVWPVIMGLVFTLRSVGFAFNEVVVLHIERPGGRQALWRFTLLLATSVTLILLTLAATPLALGWFDQVSALSPPLALLGTKVIWLALLMPAASVFQSYFMGQLVHYKKTRAVTESVIIYTVVTSIILVGGILYGQVAGIFIGQSAVLVGNWCQVFWLSFRARTLLPRDGPLES